jgi:hypothetical protein
MHAFNADLSSQLNISVYGAIGAFSPIFPSPFISDDYVFTLGNQYVFKGFHTSDVTYFPLIFVSFTYSEAAPVNSFPRNTTHTNFTAQWVFDTQSADWTVSCVVISFCSASLSLRRAINKH